MANEVWAGSRRSTSTSISAAAKIQPWRDGEKGWWAAEPAAALGQWHLIAPKESTFLGLCSTFVALLCVPVLSIPGSPLASPDRKARGAEWLELVLCVRAQPQHHFPGAGLLPACPAVPTIVDSGACGGSFSTGKEKHCWLSPSSVSWLHLDLGASAATCRGAPNSL